jgi:hypothetical protein
MSQLSVSLYCFIISQAKTGSWVKITSDSLKTQSSCKIPCRSLVTFLPYTCQNFMVTQTKLYFIFYNCVNLSISCILARERVNTIWVKIGELPPPPLPPPIPTLHHTPFSTQSPTETHNNNQSTSNNLWGVGRWLLGCVHAFPDLTWAEPTLMSMA